jgi:hypothetical protein
MGGTLRGSTMGVVYLAGHDLPRPSKTQGVPPSGPATYRVKIDTIASFLTSLPLPIKLKVSFPWFVFHDQ